MHIAVGESQSGGDGGWGGEAEQNRGKKLGGHHGYTAILNEHPFLLILGLGLIFLWSRKWV